MACLRSLHCYIIIYGFHYYSLNSTCQPEGLLFYEIFRLPSNREVSCTRRFTGFMSYLCKILISQRKCSWFILFLFFSNSLCWAASSIISMQIYVMSRVCRSVSFVFLFKLVWKLSMWKRWSFFLQEKNSLIYVFLGGGGGWLVSGCLEKRVFCCWN